MTDKPRTRRTVDLDALVKSIEQATAPIRDLQEQLAAAFSPFAGMQDRINKQVDGWQQNLRRTLGSSGFKETLTSMGAVIQHVQMLPLEMTKQLITLAQHGWYIDPEMTIVVVQKLRNAFENGGVDSGQAWFMAYYREHLDAIEERLVERHPKRAKVIAAGCRAHRAGDYELSVPPFISQADGIALDLHGRQLYSKRNKVGLRGLVEDLPLDDFDRVLWSVFKENSPLTDNTDQLPPGFEGLNRHAVLHGLDVAYGTEVNSLKALSLLNYAAYALAPEDA